MHAPAAPGDQGQADALVLRVERRLVPAVLQSARPERLALA